jgi:predicted dehydrogenase
MLKIAIVGCGKVADQHVHAIRRIPDCGIVAVCDHEPMMAKQLAERFGISACFSDINEMLRVVSPSVVHITTPPQSHYSIAEKCLKARSNVYLEKPFTVTAGETRSLIDLAERCGLKITVGHNYQFTLEMLEMRQLVRTGFLGGEPVHLESYWSYDLGDTSYVGPLLGNRDHWVRRLPGQLFHNIISHGVAKLAEFLDDELIEIVSTAHQSKEFSNLGASEVLDELRVSIRDKNGVTAFFCFSTQIKALNQLRLYGPANSLVADIVTGSLTRRSNHAYKSYLTYFIPPIKNAREHFRNATRNIGSFVRRRLYQDFGTKELVERFYNSIRSDSLPPIPYREIMLTARIMDEIFAQVYAEQRAQDGKQVTDGNAKGKATFSLVPCH